jgi:hypothetical protein
MKRQDAFSPLPTDYSTTVPLAVAVALADGETQQRLALWLRERAATRLGMVDAFPVVNLSTEDDEP